MNEVKVIKHFDVHSKPLCILGVLLSNNGIKIKNEMLSWLIPEYDVITVEQNLPGDLYEYPALSFLQEYCLKNNEPFALYLHTKGAARQSITQEQIRYLWKTEFIKNKQTYIEKICNSITPLVICPFSGKRKITWYNGFFINLLALKTMNTISLSKNRYVYETLFKNENNIKVIGNIFNDVDNADNGSLNTASKTNMFNYIKNLYLEKDE